MKADNQKIHYPKTFVGVIVDNLDEELLKFYQENHAKNRFFKEELFDIVDNMLTDEFEGKTQREEILKIHADKRRYYNKKKKRWIVSLEEQLNKGEYEDKKYPFPDLYAKKNSLTDEEWNKLYADQTYEDIERERLKEAIEWMESKNSRMINYPALASFTPKAVFTAFEMDLFFQAFSIMKELFDCRLDDSILKTYVDEMGEGAYFSDNRKKYVLQNESKELVEEVLMSEDGSSKLIITVSKEAFGDSNIITFLDVKDQEILSYVIRKAAREGLVNDKPILIEKSALARVMSSGQKPSARNYEDGEKRLYKMVNFTYNRFENGKQVGAVNFLESAEEVELEGKEYMSVKVGYVISEAILNNRIKQLPMAGYNRLNGVDAKLLYFPLQKERIRIYERINRGEDIENGVLLRYTDFLQFINFGGNNKAKNNQLIKKALEEYKEKGIFIEDVEYDRISYTYHIKFIPLSEEEKSDLKYYYNTIEIGEKEKQKG